MTPLDEPLAVVGVTGLATMGRNLARNLASRGHVVAVHNRSPERTEQLLREHGHEGTFVGSASVREFIGDLQRPRTVIVMVQAGDATDQTIEQLVPLMDAGDIIIDAGNAHYLDTRRREEWLQEFGIAHLGVGVSGGEQGALLGPSIMPGGRRDMYERVAPLLESIAAQVDGSPCCRYIGPDGAGHFVKMVHNGIEYADMQLIAETYDALRAITGGTPGDIAEIFRSWQGTELDGFLIDITIQALESWDETTDGPMIDIVSDQAGMKGTGTWTVQAALSLGVPVGAISEAVAARVLSSSAHLRTIPGAAARSASSSLLSQEDRDDAVAAARDSLYAAKILAYSQGLDLIKTASDHYGWDIDLGSVADVWRGGCIIRASLLEHIGAAYAQNPQLPALAVDPALREALDTRVPGWRRFVTAAVAAGVPMPVSSSTLAYADTLRAHRLPTTLVQLQRDIFGAHTYQRIDRTGYFHRDWAGDGGERISG
jgi:6-phosphogluconate dehydrogenase